MVAIPLDEINFNKVSKYANVLIFKEFYPKTKNVTYYLNVKHGREPPISCSYFIKTLLFWIFEETSLSFGRQTILETV